MIFLVIILIPSVSAVDLTSGTILNATTTNITLSFTQCELKVDKAVVSPVSIELTNPSYLTTGISFTLPNFINVTSPAVANNTALDCGDLGGLFGTSKFVCNTAERGIFKAIIIFAGLALVIFAIMLFIKRGVVVESIGVKGLIIIYVGLLIGLVMLSPIADQIGSFCPNI